MLDTPASIDRIVACQLLEDAETYALVALLCVCALLGDDILDEDGQPHSEHEMGIMLESHSSTVREENLTKVCGLLHAIAGDDYTDDPDHFRRLSSAIVEGDVFDYDDEEPHISDLYWALYQVGLTVEDSMVDSLGPRVRKYITDLAEDEAEDLEGLASAMAEEGEDPEDIEPYAQAVLVFRRAKLAKALYDLKCKPDWVEDLDPELAASMAEIDTL